MWPYKFLNALPKLTKPKLFRRNVNPIQDELFQGCSQMKGDLKRPTFPITDHIYHTMIKLSTVIPYLKKTQKLYESRDTTLEFC